MELLHIVFDLLIIFLFVVFVFLYSKENEKSRDYGTDLIGLIYEYDLDSRDLDRSLHHKEIRRKVEENYDLSQEDVDKMKDS